MKRNIFISLFSIHSETRDVVLCETNNCFVFPSKKVKRDKKQSKSISGFIVKQYIHSTGKKKNYLPRNLPVIWNMN